MNFQPTFSAAADEVYSVYAPVKDFLELLEQPRFPQADLLRIKNVLKDIIIKYKKAKEDNVVAPVMLEALVEVKSTLSQVELYESEYKVACSQMPEFRFDNYDNWCVL